MASTLLPDTITTLTQELESMKGFAETIFTEAGIGGDRKSSHWDSTLSLVRGLVKANKKSDAENKAAAGAAAAAAAAEDQAKALADANAELERLRRELEEARSANAELDARIKELLAQQELQLTGAKALEDKAAEGAAEKLRLEDALRALREEFAKLQRLVSR